MVLVIGKLLKFTLKVEALVSRLPNLRIPSRDLWKAKGQLMM